MAERINQDNFDTKILQAEGVAVADFYSDSCVPCKRISPLLAELEEAGVWFVSEGELLLGASVSR